MDCKTVDFFITNGKNNNTTAYIYLFYHYCNAFDLGEKHNDNTGIHNKHCRQFHISIIKLKISNNSKLL